MTLEDRYALVTSLITSHGERLRRFLASRLYRAHQDIPDLIQEVYMRLLRVNRPQSIRNPEAYLFTIANHVLYQHALQQVPTSSDTEVEDIPATDTDTDPASQAEIQQRLQQLDRALNRLSHKAQAVIILYRRDGLTLEEIAAELDISLTMVKKYLAKAVTHCRQHTATDE